MSYAAAVVMFLCMLVSGAVLLTGRRRRPKRPGVVVIPFGKNSAWLEREVRSAYWEESFAGRGRDIVLVRLDPEADDTVAQEIVRALPGVICLEAAELTEHIRKDN